MNWKLACVYALSEGVPQRSLWVALVVGTILNLINQGDRLLSGQHLDFTKIVLTYLVPFLVSTYGAVSFRLHAAQGDGDPG
ncbi:MAG TPA: nitrate/nitrite transporter NrtS [Stellaceae bacterium]